MNFLQKIGTGIGFEAAVITGKAKIPGVPSFSGMSSQMKIILFILAILVVKGIFKK